jgi:hypothetical protein
MATLKKAPSVSGRERKRSPRAMERAIRSTDEKVRAAIHSALRKAGVNGVTLHAVHYAIDPSAMTMSGCANCDLTTNDCVLSPEGYVCIPRSH